MLIIASSRRIRSASRRAQRGAHWVCARRVDGLFIVPAAVAPGGLGPLVLRGRRFELGTPRVFPTGRPATCGPTRWWLIDNRAAAREGGPWPGRGQPPGSIAVLLDSIGVHTMRGSGSTAPGRLVEAGAPYDERLVRDGVRDPAAARRVVAELSRAERTRRRPFSHAQQTGCIPVSSRSSTAAEATPRLLAFDDFELARLVPYPLTVIAYETPGHGPHRDRAALRRIDARPLVARTVTLPTELVERGLR
ncbi:hypothetical protein GCM10018962_98150 [Dactylosporangium matsuzakiense]|uniref:hypothetical protein n=1 Tax=Dactylosporangium matsuzakiense TaxID=53360 RepID=UPI0031F14CF3